MTTKSTGKLSREQLAWSCNMQAQILQAIDTTGQQAVANCIGIDTTAITKMKSIQGTAKHSDIERLCHLLASCGLKVVSKDMQCYDREHVSWLYGMAKLGMNRSLDVDDFLHADAAMQIAEGTYQPRGAL
ncbi:hypothetical protein [Psychrobacter nivimaris]|uniref:hypothetical protein n=1 Tax=Psychrobacter nivimaris TaxID=281738 RepID=UPI00191B89F1|nr:hypothetical protein [Psychrobacter nivimaris]